MFGDKRKRLDDLAEEVRDLKRSLELERERTAFFREQATLIQTGNMERENLMALGLKLNDLEEDPDNRPPSLDGLIARYHELYDTGPTDESMREHGVVLKVEEPSE